MNFDFLRLGLDDRVQNVSLDSGVKPASYSDDICPYMDVFLSYQEKVTTPKGHISTLSTDGTILLGHNALSANPINVAFYLTRLLENGATHHPVNSVVYAIKWTHDSVGLPNPTKNSFVSSIQGAARRKALTTVKRKEPITNDVIK